MFNCGKLDDTSKEQRLLFAKEFVNKSTLFWKSVVFADEQRFCFNGDGVASRYVGSEKKFIRDSVPVWACISANGQKMIKKISGRINTIQYKDILQELVSTSTIKPVNLVHDHYPVHHARAIMSWINENNKDITVLPWPPKFGDVMPMERIWNDLITEIKSKSVKLQNENDLWQEINEAWKDIFNDEFVKNVIDRIPLYLEKVIENKGDWIE